MSPKKPPKVKLEMGFPTHTSPGAISEVLTSHLVATVAEHLAEHASTAASVRRAMDALTERIVQYPAKEQAELRVSVMLPGNMFPGLTLSEQRAKYEAEAFDYELSHTFPKKTGVLAKPMTCEGIRFLCISDVMEDASHTTTAMAMRRASEAEGL